MYVCMSLCKTHCLFLEIPFDAGKVTWELNEFQSQSFSRKLPRPRHTHIQITHHTEDVWEKLEHLLCLILSPIQEGWSSHRWLYAVSGGRLNTECLSALWDVSCLLCLLKGRLSALSWVPFALPWPQPGGPGHRLVETYTVAQNNGRRSQSRLSGTQTEKRVLQISLLRRYKRGSSLGIFFSPAKAFK